MHWIEGTNESQNSFLQEDEKGIMTVTKSQ